MGDFWKNRNGEQEALINGWKAIWEHYKNEPDILGYDLMNKPSIEDLGVNAEVFDRDYLIPFYQKVIEEHGRNVTVTIAPL